MLHGREPERAQIESLLERARARRSGVLLLRGDTGIGKSALLDDAVARAQGMAMLRAGGVDTESELAYAALHQLLRPVLHRIDALPATQADALRAAFGLSAGPAGDRFAVSVGVLGLLAEVADDSDGVLVVVDDLQWLDQPSADALLFVARRVEAEGVALLMACGVGGRAAEIAGVPELSLGGLSADAAMAVLAEHAVGELAPAVAEPLLTVAAGNPLALCELPSSLTADQLVGREGIEYPLPVRDHVERALRRRVAGLGEHARALLVLAAADDTGDWSTLRLAALLLDIDPAAMEELEEAGLLVCDERGVVFPQPLVRSVAYRGATSWQRRSAHRGLAEALEDDDAPDRRAWHLAAGAEAPDDEIADELEHSALRARLRSGHAAAATALERAADLTRSDGERGRRLLAAAEAYWLAGRGARAVPLLQRAEPLTRDSRDLRVTAASLRGAYELEYGSPEVAYEVLVSAARTILREEPARALEMLLRAGDAAWWSGRLDRAAEIGTLAAAVPPSDREGEAFMVDLLIGVAEVLHGDFARGAEALRRALALADTFDHPRYLLPAAHGAVHLGDDAAATRFAERTVAALRGAGAIGELPGALEFAAGIALWRGQLADAAANGFEALELATETRQETTRAYVLALLASIDAARGDEEACRARAREALDIATLRGLTLHAAFARWARARLDLGLGRYEQALETFAIIADERRGVSHPMMALFAAPDIVEVAVRCGEFKLAESVIARLDAWAARARSPWSLAWSSALNAFVAAEGWEPGFADALAGYDSRDLPFDEARVRLLYGERLRDAGRAGEAREQAWLALVAFERIGADLWSRRARADLAAAGGRPAAMVAPRPLDSLTPQEQQIARFVSGGATNREVGAKLFLSPRTVQYHLHNIYLKLGIGSRTELAGLLGADGRNPLTVG